jgi:hypothetical protein
MLRPHPTIEFVPEAGKATFRLYHQSLLDFMTDLHEWGQSEETDPQTPFTKLRPEQQMLVFYHLLGWLRGGESVHETAEAQAYLMDEVNENLVTVVEADGSMYANMAQDAQRDRSWAKSEVAETAASIAQWSALMRAAGWELSWLAPPALLHEAPEKWTLWASGLRAVSRQHGRCKVRPVGIHEFLLICVALEDPAYGLRLCSDYRQELAMAHGSHNHPPPPLFRLNPRLTRERDLKAFLKAPMSPNAMLMLTTPLPASPYARR